MTFDEVDKYIKENCYLDQYGDKALDLDGIDDLITLLKKEYAPTIEMTIFERTNAVGLLDFKRDELTFVVGSNGDGTPILDTLPKRYFSAWLHPETIKIVDE